MAGRLHGRTALVTGGLSGIGAAVVRRLAAEGARVVAADLSAEAGALGPGGPGGAVPLRLDVTDPASVASAVEAVVARDGRLDCAVNCAGIGVDVPFLDTTLDTFDRIVAVNLRGTFIVGQAVARAMRQGGGGSIVNVASVAGLTGLLGRSAYGASKGGVVQLSRVMAVDLAADRIRVNALAPGAVETPLVARMHTEATRAQWTERTPMHRYGTPDEVAAAAAFLCSDDAGFVTGHVLAVDGGFSGSGLTVPAA